MNKQTLGMMIATMRKEKMDVEKLIYLRPFSYIPTTLSLFSAQLVY